MYRRERYFDKNDRPKNLYGQEKEFMTKDKVDEEEEITQVIDNNESKTQNEKKTSP